MLDFFDPNAGGSQTVTHRLRGKPRTMLHSIKPLFFNRGDQFAVVDDRRRCVTVICVYAKNVQVKNCELRMSNFGFQDPREVSGVEFPARAKDCFLLALQTLSRPCRIATTVNDGGM